MTSIDKPSETGKSEVKDSPNQMMRDENIAAVSAAVFADHRLGGSAGLKGDSFIDRLHWCIRAGWLLTELEPQGGDGYEAKGLDWYIVTDSIADGFFEDRDPRESVERALIPPSTRSKDASVSDLLSCLIAYVEREEQAAPASSSPLRERARGVIASIAPNK